MYRRFSLPLLLLLALVSGVRGETAPPTPEQERFFEQKVRPVLAEHCWQCHGATKQESDLRLDSPVAIARGGASGEAMLRAGHADESYLLKVVKHEVDTRMPPEKKLSDEQIASLAEWVNQGAFWPASAASEPLPLSAAERVEVHRREHWAYQPVSDPAPPEVKNAAWVANSLDRFVLAKLEEQGVAPSAEADRRTLIRRLTFDLTGLPATYDDIEAFVADMEPGAYERVVDRLLASPRYGERWGRHWLDVARYADTMGYAFERDRRYPFAYTYRDYVIDALNRDVPYDRFLKEQLAADQLEPQGDPRSLAALGFLTVGRKYLAIHDTYDDQIDVVTRGMLGLTVACARCHDHKYDAIPTEDYYSLYGVFSNLSEPDTEQLPLLGDPKAVAGYEEFEKEMKRLQGDVDAYVAERHNEIVNTGRAKAADYLFRVAYPNPNDELLAKFPFLTLKPDEIRPKLLERWSQYLKQHAQPDHAALGLWADLAALPEEGFAEKAAPVLEAWRNKPAGVAANHVNPKVLEALRAKPPQSKGELAQFYGQLLTAAWDTWKAIGGSDEEALAKLNEETRQLAAVLVAKEAPTQFPVDQTQMVFNRAERTRITELQKQVKAFQASSPAAPPRAMIVRDRDQPHNARVFIRGNSGRPGNEVPRQFPVVLAGAERKPFLHKSGRLELAESIASPSNPLTRRVIVNRVWMHHFGEPLVATPSDFGVRTAKPVQADLLDHLASYLLQEGWSLKRLHRYIVLSATYRQQSADRPEAAAVDPENKLLWKMNRRRLEWESLRDAMLVAANRLDTSVGGRPVELTQSPFPLRRTVYGYIDRQDLPNLFRMFDIASPDQSAAQRPRTTVPQQSLFLMNSPFALEQGQALANRSDLASADTAARIAGLYRATLSRLPTPHEIEVAKGFIDTATSDAAGAQLSPWEQLGQLLLMTNEFAYVD
jgi:cytochrome c553